MSNRDKKYTPPKRAPRKSSPGAEALLRATAENEQQRREAPFDGPELPTGRTFAYEWEERLQVVEQRLTTVESGGGSGGGSRTHVHEQASAAAVWTIAHTLATRPDVLVVDGAGQQLIAEVRYPNDSTVTVTHGSPYAGTAYLRA